MQRVQVSQFFTASRIWLLFVVLTACCLALAPAHPVTGQAAAIVIDAAPSVVSYQGLSQTRAHLVLAPMGRALGYVQPLNVSHSLPRNQQLDERAELLLDIKPIYMHQ